MPPADDYHAALNSAALFPRPEWGYVELAGPEAAKFLHNLSTNAVAALPAGSGCEAYFCSPQAKALNHGFIDHVLRADGERVMMIQTDPGQLARLTAHIDRHWISEQIEFQDVSGELASFHLAGPRAAEMLGAAELTDLRHVEKPVGGVDVRVRRNDRLGVPGFDLIARRPGPTPCETP